MPFLLFFTVPIIEVAILVQVGGVIGFWATLGLVVLTAVIGAQLLKSQGRALLMAAKGRLEQGQLPLSELAQGLLVAIGGALLLTPGFATDAFGFACLFPGTRLAMGRAVQRWLEPRLVRVNPGPGFGPGPGSGSNSQTGDVIDGEFRRDD